MRGELQKKRNHNNDIVHIQQLTKTRSTFFLDCLPPSHMLSTHLHQDARSLGRREGDFVHEVRDVPGRGREAGVKVATVSQSAGRCTMSMMAKPKLEVLLCYTGFPKKFRCFQVKKQKNKEVHRCCLKEREARFISLKHAICPFIWIHLFVCQHASCLVLQPAILTTV